MSTRDIKPVGPGKYSGYDLPWMSNYTLQVSADGSLAVSIQTALMPINFKLLPVQLDNQAWFNQEMQAAGLQPASALSAAPAYQFTPPPGYGDQTPVYAGGYQPQQPGYPVQPPAAPVTAPPVSAEWSGQGGPVANPDDGENRVNPW